MSPPDRQGFVQTECGLNLHWEAHGQGPTLLCCNGVGVSTFFWKYIVQHFSSAFQVVLWDYRGHGQSQDPPALEDCDLSIEACARDLASVQRAVGAENAVILGHSMGCQVALEHYRQSPEKVAGLVLMLGSAGRVLDTFFDTPQSVHVHRILKDLVWRFGPGSRHLVRALFCAPWAWSLTRRARMVDPHYTTREDFSPYLSHLARLDPRLFLEMVGQAHLHDAFDLLPRISVPALVVAGERDSFTPLSISRRMASEIPRADLLVLADGSHAAIIEHPDSISHRLRRFLLDCELKPGEPLPAS
jgi:pimeloyl-ACP methyl ester carboxylesterase